MTLGKKIVTSKLILVIVPVALLTGIAVWQARIGFGRAVDSARTAFEANSKQGAVALEESGLTDLTHQAQAVHAMCMAQQEALEQKLQSDLKVATDVLREAGGLKLGSETLTWKAANQVNSGEIRSVELPNLLAGDRPLGQNADAKTPAPVVDRVRELVGGACTIFQRMGTTGDLLRVCTNVQKADGTRAIGTYIPAANPDGTPNPVAAAMTKGEKYVGRAFVVDRWYIAAYEPLRDANGQIIGALFVGVPQESAASLRKAIMSMKVGKTGYVYVLNAKGDTRGHYVISAGGKRDGEDIWEMKDADGKPVIQGVCASALALKNGEVGEIRYPWKNADDPKPREKIVKLAYFEPWDWVIGVGAYLDEFQDAIVKMDEQARVALREVEQTKTQCQAAVVAWCGGIAGAAATLALLVALFVTRSITKPVNRIVNGLTEGAEQVNEAAAQVAGAAQHLAEGNNAQAASLEETSSALVGARRFRLSVSTSDAPALIRGGTRCWAAILG